MFIDPPRVNQYFPIQVFIDPPGGKQNFPIQVFIDPPRVNQYFPIQVFMDPLGQVVGSTKSKSILSYSVVYRSTKSKSILSYSGVYRSTKSKSILSYSGVSGSARPGCWIHQVQVAAAVGVYVGEGEESPTEPGLPAGRRRVDATDRRQMSATRGSCGGHPAGGGRGVLSRRTRGQ